MPSKKKKFNARFPAGRIKKIMQTDEEVGKVAQAVPVIISRTLELFVESLLLKAMEITSAKNAKTLTPSHMKQCIMSDQRFDFLKDMVKNVADSANGEEDSFSAGFLPTQTNKHISERRKSNSTVVKEIDYEEITIEEDPITIKTERIKQESDEEITVEENPVTIKTERVKQEPDEEITIKKDPVAIKTERVKKEPDSIAVPVIRSTKSEHIPVGANCSTLHLNPNFYKETSQEQEVSIHAPPLVSPSFTQLPRISQVHPESKPAANPPPILVMDEDYDT